MEAQVATTEPSPAGLRPPRRALSVRTRITVTIALLTALAMGGAGLLVHTLESARIERAVTEQVDQEIAEFRQLQDGDDPRTTRPFDSVQRLLRLFLVRNVPDDDELLVGYAGRAQALRTRNRYGEQILGDPSYERAVDDHRGSGGTTVLDSAEFGEVWVTVVPVRNNDTRGALVIVNFLDDEHSELNRTMQTYAIVAVLSLGLIVMLAGYRSGRLLAPLRTLRQTAEEISATDLSRRIPTKGNDDITALTQTVNGMLARLQAAFEGQREFLDDAGHELKTPLTVLRGHLELLDQGDRAEVEQTQRLLLDEVDRMSRLVEDLILLAKSRRPDFLAPRPVDVEALTRMMLAKASALGDRRWELDAAADVVVGLDEQRITQAVLQLADNAVKHTVPGDVVGIGSAQDGRRVRLWVRDTGPGIRADDRELVFQRFGRSAVRPGDEGFGLGLSIVRAIVEAHGGRVWVEPADASAPSEQAGARFVVELSLEEDQWPTF
jgi:two-component system OmpR family sensor kinase